MNRQGNAETLESRRGDASPEHASGRRTARVLVVDDEKSIRVGLCSLLTDAGYAAETAEDARAVHSMLSRGAYDVVVSDIVLPRVSGLALLQQIRQTAPDVQVIMMTGEPTVETAAEAVRAGAADYLVKPVSKPAILRSVGNAARVKALEDERKRLEKETRDCQTQLEHQNAELKKAAKFREDVEAITRHDLKSPLSVVIAMPQILVESGRNLNEEQVHCLRTIEEAGRKMLDMINLSLDLFRMEQGMYELRPVPVNLAEVLAEVLKHQESLCRSLRVSTRVLIDGEPAAPNSACVVDGERLLFYSLLSNLIKNAIEASPPGETVTVSVQQGSPMTIRILNRGAVPADIRERFFRKYVTKGKQDGTGLGAYTARRMTEAQGGSIRLDASDEDATTIILTFPSQPSVCR
jgi:signal transduction histidine kinase